MKPSWKKFMHGNKALYQNTLKKPILYVTKPYTKTGGRRRRRRIKTRRKGRRRRYRRRTARR